MLYWNVHHGHVGSYRARRLLASMDTSQTAELSAIKPTIMLLVVPCVPSQGRLQDTTLAPMLSPNATVEHIPI